jgi:hypothetical protein
MYTQVGSTDCWRLFYDPDSNQFWLRMHLWWRGRTQVPINAVTVEVKSPKNQMSGFSTHQDFSPPKLPERDLAVVDVTFSIEMETAVLDEE